jgi:hypothetical protein
MRWGVVWAAITALAAVATVAVMAYQASDEHHAPRLTAKVSFGPIVYPPDVEELILSNYPPGAAGKNPPAAGYFRIRLENGGNDTAEKVRLHVPDAKYFVVESDNGEKPIIVNGNLFRMDDLAPRQQQNIKAFTPDEPHARQAEAITFSYKAGEGKVILSQGNSDEISLRR